MTTNEIKLPFGMRADNGRIVSIDTVIRGLACECICPECKVALVAAKGDIIRHHFKHYADDGKCGGGRETALHKFAKQVICDELALDLPAGGASMGAMLRAEPEVWLDGIRPDVLAHYASEDIAIEVYVEHRVPLTKIEMIHERKLCTMEIDLSWYRDAVDLDEPRLREAVLSKAERHWIYEPAYIRKARELDLIAKAEAAERARQEAEENERLAAIERAEEMLREEEAKAAWEAEQQRQATENRLLFEAQQQLREAKNELKREALRRQQAEERARIARVEARQFEVARREAEIQAHKQELERACLARIKADLQPPDLQQLVLAHGTYDKITPEAWVRFDREREAWKARIRSGDYWWELQQLRVAG